MKFMLVSRSSANKGINIAHESGRNNIYKEEHFHTGMLAKDSVSTHKTFKKIINNEEVLMTTYR